MDCRICGEPIAGRGLCKRHYYQARRRGTLLDNPTMVETGTSKRPMYEKLFNNYEVDANGCWIFTGTINKTTGYGYVADWPKHLQAHVESFKIFKGPIPKGKILRHTCDVRPCINPEHLIVGTKKDNAQDCCARRRHNPICKLTREDARRIKDDPRSQSLIALSFGVNQSQVSRIKSGKRRSYY